MIPTVNSHLLADHLPTFPGGQLIACDQQVVDEARGQTSPRVMASWNSRFAGQLPQSPAVPALSGSGAGQVQHAG